MSRTTRGEFAEICQNYYHEYKMLDLIDMLIDESKYTSNYNKSCLLGLKKELLESIEKFEKQFRLELDVD